MKYLLIILGILAISCSTKTAKDNAGGLKETGVIYLHPSSENTLLLSDIIQSMDLAFLETTESCLLAGIKKLCIDGDYFIQNEKDELVYVFDGNGRFKVKIGSRGGGPGEFSYPHNSALDKKRKEVWMVDNYHSFVKFSYDGAFIERLKNDTERPFADFIILDNGYRLYHTSKFHYDDE